ncbi:MAG: hypothetical protein IPM32_17430 [Ignavibacteriae bacterium]|nr:hypothetical protein [Ignavibacteriota bacterium]
MIITEKDIFTFVFFRNNLSKIKCDYIIENTNTFKEKIIFLKEMMNEISSKLNPQVWNKIKTKINNIAEPKIFILQKKNFIPTNSEKKLVLAAASKPTAEINYSPITFSDEDSNYIVKVFSNNESNKIYVFPNESVVNKYFELKIFPGEDTFTFSDFSSPLIINPVQQIDSIELKIV